MKKDFSSLSGRLAILRKNKKLSQSDIANKLGVAFRTYQNYEQEKNPIPHTIIIKLAKILSSSVDFILVGEDRLVKIEQTILDIKNNTNVETRLENGVLITTIKTPLSLYIG